MSIQLPAGGRRYLRIAENLVEQITTGVYAPGDRLPPERELSAQMEASRTTIREALLALEIMRFVEIRGGAGVFVLPEASRGIAQAELAVKGEIGPWEVLEARRAVEGQTAYYAAQRASGTVLDEIAGTIEAMDASLDDLPNYDAADAQFHALVAAAAGNALFENYVEHLWRLRGGILWVTWYNKTRRPENRRRSVEDHRNIHRALLRGQPEVAQTAMRAHLDVLADRFLELKL